MSAPDRRKAHSFKAERQAAFSRNVRKEFLDDGRKQKDVERQRMEAYRRLCREEGIQSKRLEEYDTARREASEGLAKALQSVDYDQNLTNNEKKKRKYNLKRKFAATTVNDIIDKKSKRYTAITGIEQVQQRREKQKEEARLKREECQTNKNSRLEARKSRNYQYAKRTGKGQPVMSCRMETLLEKIAKK